MTNFEIKHVFKEINKDDLNENFLGVFPSDKINKLIMFERMMPSKKYPFVISNTDRSDKNGTHWWSILNISPNSELFFYSFRIDGMKHFIVQDDKKLLEKC